MFGLDFDSYTMLNPLTPFWLFLDSLCMVNFNARMLLLLSGLLKEVARMYLNLHLIVVIQNWIYL